MKVIIVVNMENGYNRREILRTKYSDKYLYENIIGIEYSDWDSEADRYGNAVPCRYIHLRDDSNGCGIDIAGYVKRKDDDFDNSTYQQMSFAEQWWYRMRHSHLEYVEQSIGLTQLRNCWVVPFIQDVFGSIWFEDPLSHKEDAFTFLAKWPTFEFYEDYLDNYDKCEIEKGLVPSFELIFTLENGERIYIDGVPNEFSEELIEKLMSMPILYRWFKDKISIWDWNDMFHTNIQQ